jgi:hypothetical protein
MNYRRKAVAAALALQGTFGTVIFITALRFMKEKSWDKKDGSWQS